MTRVLKAIVVLAALGATLIPSGPGAEAYGYRYGYYGRPYWGRPYWGRPYYGYYRYRCYGCYGYYGNPYAWRAGYWWRGWRAGTYSWWWVANGYWYPYAAPVYPYPAYPYPAYAAPPPAVVVAPPGYGAPAPVQNWYYCANPRGYYPYVQTCRVGWRAVPAAPPAAPRRR